jgi:beta-lactamase regulating signal transducer with metallopeptidase domain/biopolymer transport protein ExbD
MESLLAYLLKSTICISVLYLVFRWTLKKETLFALSRYLLLAILLFSLAIPMIKLPELFPQTIDVKVLPEQRFHAMPNMEDVAVQITTTPTTQQASVSTERTISIKQITTIVYAIGVLILFISLLIALAKIGTLLLSSKIYKKRNYNLALVNGVFSPMSFGKFIIMSKQDYKDHRKEILKHELAHIQFKHTYDLILVELIKLFHWFNPLVYQLRNDLKEIQEFQVDRQLIRSGINSKEYQLLLIKKCVGAERYALANSFNHCQIKNRIIMMNNSNNSKGKSWKVAIFLPVAALMLMAFGNNRSELPPKSSPPEFRGFAQEKKIWTESDFKTIPINELNNLEKHDFIHENWYVVLMDRKSRVIMDNELTESNEISTKMNKMLEDALAKVSSNSKNETKSIATKVLIRTDIATDPSDYNNLLTVLANSVIDARKKLSESKFNMSYDNLNSENRRVIDTLIPMSIYIAYPNQARGKTATEVPSICIDITPKGIFLNDELASLEKMKSKISKQVAEKPETEISVRVGIGASDKQVNEVKSALRETRALHINYSTDVKETEILK